MNEPAVELLLEDLDGAVPSEQLGEVVALLQHDEARLAVEALCDAIVSSSALVSEAFFHRLQGCAGSLGVPADVWGRVRGSVR